ncbi:hypothetical protein BO71DRAFT_387257 [Aspergillus ellipticus CBS 707.79]|uniref:Zn(2)-C6 fungal-type domain-containing protein n=1 Tax=Aspergillus ellipticus CBS 707.79 TaxID=1448320 RepID=A0A319CZF5_9EURO|nr:hypothetical protein BO71DRAFT_387257 [Aspergillus ellipticus CBS 707.79]
MDSTDSSNDQQQASSRQRPGSACAECRRRKLRCDGKQPQCENCFLAGVACVMSPPSSRRGPKKGHLKTLQTRISNLENQLLRQGNGQITDIPSIDGSETVDMLVHAFQAPLPVNNGLPQPVDLTPPGDPLVISPFGVAPGEALEAISDVLRADLDQLYFDRVHSFVPILHQQSYLLWTKDFIKTEARRCLQYAMWAMVASMSAQLEHLREPLYRSALRLLESLKDVSVEFYQIEHVQAWLMVSIYEFTRLTYDRGWMSAGQCFRLVQLMKLHEIDNAETTAEPEGWIRTEEKRRVFWMAYVLDCFISMRSDYPLTFNERIIMTRLPANEHAFQTGQLNEPSDFLSEAVDSEASNLAPFTGSIILATLCGRSLSHRQQTTVEQIYSGVSDGFWERHQWLDSILTEKAEAIATNCPVSSTWPVDPVHLFNNLLAQSSILYHCRALESVVGSAEGNQTLIIGSRQRALSAAEEIVRLAKMLSELSYFKVHPLAPLPVVLCAEFFMKNQDLDATTDLQLQEILHTLQTLANISNLSQAWNMEV